MTLPSLVWGSPRWLTGALVLLGIAGILILWSYARARAAGPVRAVCAALKGIAFAVLVLSLVEPLLTGSRPKQGANAFVILADNSQSLLVRDDRAGPSRGEWVRGLLHKDAPWRTRLGQDFDVRGYAFDSHLRAVDGFEGLTFDGTSTSLSTALAALARRFHGLPLAGVLLVTDGNRTDTGDLDGSQLPPIYPVVPPSRSAVKDVGVRNVAVSQTNFESAPVVVRADVAASGFAGETIVAAVTDEAGNDVERLEARASGDGKPTNFRFQFRPDKKGIHFYKVRAFAESDPSQGKESDAAASPEQTLANNSRLVVVDQGGGPYRVLYVGGRPNWEFKFLRRAIQDDEQVQLVGLLRIAHRQPKFDFRNPRDSTASPFYKGFDNADAETAERHDEPVLVRLGTEDEVELRDGFPKAIEELYRYHAVILDDLEAGFFTQDQLALLRTFVSRRGGGLLMLGGPDSFVDGKYDRTPVGDLLPVYLNRRDDPPGDGEYHLVLTREGWLQPWVRTRKTEDDERRRLAAMTPFHTLSHVGNVKPGAVVLSEVRDAAGQNLPALVAQQFGKGHVAALLIGDLWRWGLRRESLAEDDLDRSWRQTVRWLVGDVPGRVDIAVRPKGDASAPAVEIQVRPRDAEFRPLDNAKVSLRVTRPGGDVLTLDADPDGREAGAYAATYAAKEPGPYRVLATVTAPDGSAVGQREAGWAAQPAADEFARLEPDRDYLQSIASQTHGELVDGANLDSFVRSLSSRAAPITEPWTSPLWHQPLYFLIAIACLTAEWGLRRVNGLA
ncbi:MAG: glutamine amidotransferase [Isosphaeraceae bacterium]|nr:glutamine amidotransferase [Isosphaeraceae bacterium]